ncbi:hypothetical protein DQG13_17270 [Paenibacillus sp. YN15]|nr:hypothetical protein DQG13_17270 [Paenibacillus sp. YN15]
MRGAGGGKREGRAMTVILIATLFLFLYLIYALIHPEKF